MKFRDEIWKVMALDPGMMLQCSQKLQRKYTRSGIVLSIMAFSCVLSGAYAFFVIAGNWIPAIPFGIVWAWMIINLYRLTLVTVGNKFMPPSSTVRFPVISLFVRLVFLSMLAFFISKPIEILIHSAAISPELSLQKEKILKDTEGQEEWVTGSIVGAMKHKKGYYAARVLSSGYLIRRMEILHAKFPGTWWFTGGFIALFLWPFWVRVRISGRSEYEKIRAEVEKGVIMAEYNAFKQAFQEYLAGYGNGKITWQERYKDAPFNTVPGKEKHEYNRKGSLKSWMIEP